MDKEKRIRPIAVDIDDSTAKIRTENTPGQCVIIYTCPSCEKKLCRFLGKKEKHCHNCGQALQWDVIMHINEQQSKLIVDASGEQKETLIQNCVEAVNKLNSLF